MKLPDNTTQGVKILTPKTNEYDKALIHSLRRKLHIRTTENIELREENEALKNEIARVIRNRNQTAEIPTQRYRRQHNPDDWA